MELEGFRASNGWLAGFKERFGIKFHRPHGESGAPDLAGIDRARDALDAAEYENFPGENEVSSYLTLMLKA